jgi:hypothetical protein
MVMEEFALTKFRIPRQRGARVAWISLDANDDDPGRLFASLVRALQPLGMRYAEEPAAVIAGAAGAGSLTTGCANPVLPPAEAVMRVEPGWCAVTRPLALTARIVASWLLHVTAWPVRILPLLSSTAAVSCTELPTDNSGAPGDTTMFATGLASPSPLEPPPHPASTRAISMTITSQAREPTERITWFQNE